MRAERVAHVVRYTVKDAVTGELGSSSLALSIVALAPDPVPILRAFERRVFLRCGLGAVRLALRSPPPARRGHGRS